MLPALFLRVMCDCATPFAERTVLSPYNCLRTSVKNQLTINVWAYFQTLSSDPLICVSVLCPAPHVTMMVT